jgi:hypothetical protein
MRKRTLPPCLIDPSPRRELRLKEDYEQSERTERTLSLILALLVLLGLGLLITKEGADDPAPVPQVRRPLPGVSW